MTLSTWREAASLDAEPELRLMVEYSSRIDALGIRYGAMHTEVKLETRGPVLVEVNGGCTAAFGCQSGRVPRLFSGLGMADAYFDSRLVACRVRSVLRARCLGHGAREFDGCD